MTYPEAFWYRYTGMGAQIIGTQIIVKWRRKKRPINIWRLLLSPKFQRRDRLRCFCHTFDEASMWNKIKMLLVSICLKEKCWGWVNNSFYKGNNKVINKWISTLLKTWLKIKMAGKGCTQKNHEAINRMFYTDDWVGPIIMITRTDLLLITARFLPMFHRWWAAISSTCKKNCKTQYWQRQS